MLSLARSVVRVTCVVMVSARARGLKLAANYATSSLIRPLVVSPSQCGRISLVNVPSWRYCATYDAFHDVDTEELLVMLESKNIQLIDVREPWELIERGRIPSSVNIPCRLEHYYNIRHI